MQTQFLFANSYQILDKFLENKHIIILADSNTNGFCVEATKKFVPQLQQSQTIVIPQGETYKTLDTVANIYNELVLANANRQTILVNIGGGLVCDIGGFVAATYMRGLSFVNIPTTVLAMNDACFGGKTGVNFMGAKNMIGQFYHPEIVYFDVRFLKTLPLRQYKSGFAEMLKHGLIADEKLWNRLVNLAPSQVSEEDIKNSVAIKLSFTQQDPLDNNLRQALNFGHTIGHALESMSHQTNNTLLHGEAVLLGMYYELILSENILGLSSQYSQQLHGYISQHFPALWQVKIEPIVFQKFILLDKKNTDKVICCLLKNIAMPVPQTVVPWQDILAIIPT